jgi:hypothetical protein
MVDCIGTFYETPFGIVKTYGYDRSNGDEIISWYRLRRTKGFRNYYEYGSIRKSDTADWIRSKVSDFPGSVDEILPYSFDLLFDIKRMSQLRSAFRHEDSEELLETMKSHSITFKKRRDVIAKRK